MKTITFKYGTSRGRETYGYNLVSMYVNGDKVASCNGGGYDMKGACMGEWLTKTYPEQLKKLPSNYGSLDDKPGYYGLSFYNNKTRKRQHRWSKHCSIGVDGACGTSSMERISKAIGVELKSICIGKNEWGYIFDDSKIK